MTRKRGVRNRVYQQFDVVGARKMAKLFGNVPPWLNYLGTTASINHLTFGTENYLQKKKSGENALQA